MLIIIIFVHIFQFQLDLHNNYYAVSIANVGIYYCIVGSQEVPLSVPDILTVFAFFWALKKKANTIECLDWYTDWYACRTSSVLG